MEGLIVILIIIFIIVSVRFNNRMSKIEKRLFLVESKKGSASEKESLGKIEAFSSQNQFSYQKEEIKKDDAILSQKKESSYSALKREDFAHKGSSYWLIKIGMGLLVLSVIWFVTYAFVNDWISPVGRIALGILLGVGLILFGTTRFKKDLRQGLVFLMGGATSFYVAVFSGMFIYEFYGPFTALLSMSLVIVYMAVLCFVSKMKELGLSTLILGFITPLFVFYALEMETLFLYFFLLSLGMMWLDYALRWRTMTLISFVGVFFYSLVMAGQIDVSLTNFIFVILFLILFFVSSIASIISSQSIQKEDYGITLLSGLAFFVWMRLVIPEELFGIAYILGALLYSLSSYGVYFFTKVATPTLLYGSVAFGLLVAATAELLEGSSFTALLAVELGGLIMISLLFFRDNLPKWTMTALGILFLWPIALSFENIDDLVRLIKTRMTEYFSFSESLEHLFILILFIGIFWSIFFMGKRFLTHLEIRKTLLILASSLGAIYSFLLLWFFFHLIISDQYLASMASLILFSLIGAYLYVFSKIHATKEVSLFGIIILAFVLLRLFFVEFWIMEMATRIITFFVIGVVFIGASMIAKRGDERRERIQ